VCCQYARYSGRSLQRERLPLHYYCRVRTRHGNAESDTRRIVAMLRRRGGVETLLALASSYRHTRYRAPWYRTPNGVHVRYTRVRGTG